MIITFGQNVPLQPGFGSVNNKWCCKNVGTEMSHIRCKYLQIKLFKKTLFSVHDVPQRKERYGGSVQKSSKALGKVAHQGQ